MLELLKIIFTPPPSPSEKLQTEIEFQLMVLKAHLRIHYYEALRFEEIKEYVTHGNGD